ncbi:MAG: metalloregulator ArsR/SmtB family transcription factor, partial [Bacillota bacterium]|nr:metalloregulator ArsR/SmtB family transcription factor [Bacillota bacterium]
MRLRKESDELQEEEILLVSQISDALAHPARVKIFRYIYLCNRNRKAVCNKDVVEAFDYSQATISQHIKKLVQARLVEARKVEKYSYYYVNIGILGRYLNAV